MRLPLFRMCAVGAFGLGKRSLPDGLPVRTTDSKFRSRPLRQSSGRAQEFYKMPKRTFQPNRRHRAKTHGFLSRMKTKAGAAVLSRRRAKGRHKIAVSAGFRD